MLVLSRKPKQSIIVDGPCRITVLDSACKLGFEGSSKVYREEILNQDPPPIEGRKKVYFVDDDANLLTAYQRYLNHFNFEVEPFQRGREFLVHADQSNDDVSAAVLDLRLAEEDLDGLQILQQLRAWNHDYPIILLTGYGDVATCRSAFQSGCYTFLQKPLSPEDLVSTVRDAVTRFEQGEIGRRHVLKSLAG